MRPRRLSRKAIPLTIGVLTLPALATGWLLVDLESRPEQEPPSVVRTASAAEGPGAPAPVTERGASPPVPPELVLARSHSTPSAPEASRERVQSEQADASVRYAALRRLESQESAAAVEEAEALVLAASDDSQGRFLAANALAVLARAPHGRAALERCAAKAPTEDLRRAARTFLVRWSVPGHKR